MIVIIEGSSLHHFNVSPSISDTETGCHNVTVDHRHQYLSGQPRAHNLHIFYIITLPCLTLIV